jgi:urease accessory protein UreF
MNKLEKHLLDEEYKPREEDIIKDIDGFIDFLEDELKTYASWKGSLQHKDRWESKDHEDEQHWGMLIDELKNTLKTAQKLKDSYQHRATKSKERFRSRRM